ncbi:putative zinc finger protein [Blastococcus colisei]|uniref:Putative zinc finger protein n=1 Tax=Blastococcus colisei TaxID=1564162 RepID=A0A543P1W7_9ACTN|nr:zf-HC2 domain-containing protein [Blastococcus colisei]TQN38114.1 putative zinc finger protein [Blastococcus colisei]
MSCPGTVELGAYVLGALESGEARQVEQHVSGCPVCAAELAELAPLPGLLDRVPRADLAPVGVAPSPELYERVAAAALRPRRRVRLLLVAAAALAALVLGAGATAWLTGEQQRTRSATAGPVEASVTASAEGGGSALDVTVAGLRAGETCTMVAVEDDGDRHPAGEWPASPDGDGRWVGWAPVEPDAVDEVVLLGDGGRELVRVDL